MIIPANFNFALTVFSLVTLLSCDTLNRNHELENLNWLEGVWRSQDGGELGEVWKRKELALLGKGMEITGTDTTYFESMEINKSGNDINMTILVSQSGKPVVFKLNRSFVDTFRFENPSHDFPKEISYIRMNDNQLRIILRGEGKEIEFNLNRVD